MSAIAHYLEAEGIATTGISLVREHTAAMRPPRFLWVPFPLGRPLGVPHDVGFQQGVIDAAWGLLERPDGPVLEDYPHDLPEAAPGSEGGAEASEGDSELASGWACPVSFPAPSVGTEPTLRETVNQEITALAPWHARTVARRGHSTMQANLRAGAIADVLADFSESCELNLSEPLAALRPARAITLLVEDLKAFYWEAAAAQPGAVTTIDGSRAIQSWFWNETAAADLVRNVANACRTHERAGLRAIADASLVPRRYR